MTWFFAALLVLAMGVVAVVATGRGGELAEAQADRPELTLPAGRALQAEDLEELRFTTALRGYRMAEVDALLERLAAELRTRADDEGPRPTAPDA